MIKQYFQDTTVETFSELLFNMGNISIINQASPFICRIWDHGDLFWPIFGRLLKKVPNEILVEITVTILGWIPQKNLKELRKIIQGGIPEVISGGTPEWIPNNHWIVNNFKGSWNYYLDIFLDESFKELREKIWENYWEEILVENLTYSNILKL